MNRAQFRKELIKHLDSVLDEMFDEDEDFEFVTAWETASGAFTDRVDEHAEAYDYTDEADDDDEAVEVGDGET